RVQLKLPQCGSIRPACQVPVHRNRQMAGLPREREVAQGEGTHLLPVPARQAIAKMVFVQFGKIETISEPTDFRSGAAAVYFGGPRPNADPLQPHPPPTAQLFRLMVTEGL